MTPGPSCLNHLIQGPLTGFLIQIAPCLSSLPGYPLPQIFFLELYQWGMIRIGWVWLFSLFKVPYHCYTHKLVTIKFLSPQEKSNILFHTYVILISSHSSCVCVKRGNQIIFPPTWFKGFLEFMSTLPSKNKMELGKVGRTEEGSLGLRQLCSLVWDYSSYVIIL